MPEFTPRFVEVAPRVWVAHYDWMHVNITLISSPSEPPIRVMLTCIQS